jgi:tetratricopeptide (TPR) repeat protein
MNRALIEKYFEQSLSVEEQIEFERLLKADEDFKKEFDFENNLKKAFSLNERQALKQKLSSFDEVKTVKINNKKWFYAAACLFAVIGFSVWFSLQQPNNDELFNTYYQTYPNVVAPSVRGAEADNLKTKAFAAYDEGNYQTAVQLFAQIYKIDKSDYALLYQAVSLIELKELEAAKQTLTKFDDAKNSEYTPYYYWYLALVELKTNKKEKAIVRLKELATKENPMQQMAKKLLAELE